MKDNGFKIKLSHPTLGVVETKCPTSTEKLIRDYLDRPWHLVAWGILEALPPWAVAAKFCNSVDEYVFIGLQDLPLDSERLGERTFRVGEVTVELL